MSKKRVLYIEDDNRQRRELTKLLRSKSLIVVPAGTAWLMYATGHLYGQIGRKTNDKNLETAYDAA